MSMIAAISSADGTFCCLISFIIIIAVVIGVVLGVKKGKENNKDIVAGRAIKRDGDFWNTAQIFRANISDMPGFASHLFQALRDSNVCNLSGDLMGTLVINGQNWSAAMDYRTVNNAPAFDFHFTSFTSNAGIPDHQHEMNIALTAIEKSFLAFDPETMIDVRFNRLKVNNTVF